jgi:hypothetical protein
LGYDTFLDLAEGGKVAKVHHPRGDAAWPSPGKVLETS